MEKIDNQLIAPIVLFCYNRLSHLEKTVEALAKNELAPESDLYIFSDGAKHQEDVHKLQNVRDYINSLSSKNYFNSVIVKCAETNLGLAKSVINGVSSVINIRGRVIVVEDDVITSPFFLRFMNDALNRYEGDNCIGSIAGFTPNIKFTQDYSYNTFVAKRPTSIAWGTWVNWWCNIDWDVKNYNKLKYNLRFRSLQKSWGNDVPGRLDRYMAGYNSSWATRFTLDGFLKDYYALHPVKTLCIHIGYDDSGTHTTTTDAKIFDDVELSKVSIEVDDILPLVNEKIRKEYLRIYHRSSISAFIEFILIVVFKLKKNSPLMSLLLNWRRR